VEPNLRRRPYANIRFTFLSSPYLPQHFFPPLYHHFNFSSSGGAQPPTLPLRRHRIRIRLLASPTLAFFPDSLRQFSPITKRWSRNLQRHPYTLPPCPPYAKILAYGCTNTTTGTSTRGIWG